MATLHGGELLSVKIRLTRTGKTKAPFYRVVATDSRSPRDGRFIEILGRYNPRTDPSTVELDVEKIQAWVDKGAQMSETVSKLFEIAKDPEAAKAPTGKTAMSAKDKARADAEEKAKQEAEEAAAAEAEAPAEDAAEEAAAEDEEEAAEEPAAEEAADDDAANDESDEDASEEAPEE